MYRLISTVFVSDFYLVAWRSLRKSRLCKNWLEMAHERLGPLP